LNFAGPFDSELSYGSPVSLGGERFAFDSKPGFVQHHVSDSHVVVPDAHLLFSGDYTRIGSDLIISGNDQKFVVGNYFKGETRPALTTKDGATLGGHIVDALTGHVHYAQATAAPAAGQVIGNVLKMSGSASVIRNGVSIELHIGDAVQKGDVIQTGSNSSIGMTFVDGSAFGMTSNARMVLNEMIFDPNGSSNSSLMSLVQGTITFVAGQTAKNGNMRVETPVATMGIRGTAVLVEIGANDGPTKFSVLVEPDGHTGSYNLYDKVTGQLIGTVSQAGQVTFVSSLGLGQPPSAIEQLKTLQDQQAEKAIIQQVFQLYFPNYNPDDSNPKLPKFGSNTSGNNLAEILFTTNSTNKQTFLTQIELRFAVTDPNTGITTYQNRIFYNTKAVFSASSILSEQAFTSTVESFKISDLVHIDDPDIGNAPFYDVATPFVAGSAIIKSAVSTNTNLSADFLSQFLHINQTTGVITFDRLGFNFLGVGESVTFMIQVTSRSGPDVANVIIPITITGDNDVPNDNGVPNGAPTIVLSLSDIVGAVKEDTLVTPDHEIVKNGTITFRDVDLSDGHQAGVVFTSSASTLPGFAPGEHLGSFTLSPVQEDKTDTINTGTIDWHFKLDDNDPTLQSLAEGQTITQVYTVTIIDDHGASVTQTVTITITGTNDAPVLTADTSVHQAVEVADTTGAPNSVVDVATGTLTFADLDLSDTHEASAALHSGTSVVWSGGNYNDIPQATRDALNSAMTALVVENNTDTNNEGSVSWEFKLPDHLFDFLADNETLTLTYDVTVTDNNGVSSTQQITVQIGAANDKPVISVIDSGAAVQEDVDPAGGLLRDSGAVTFTDADLTDTHTAHVAYNGAVGGNGGTVSPGLLAAIGTALSVPGATFSAATHTFNWNFALDNNLVQYLGEGETVTATYTITVMDSSGQANNTSVGQTVTVIITGTNDTPVITAVDVTGAVKEDAGVVQVNTLHDTGSVTFADADTSDHEIASVAFVSDSASSGVTISGSLHTALLSALTLQTSAFASNAGTVNWDFNLDNSLVQYLADGETVTATYTITVKDDSSTGTDTSAPQTVTVTITGTNDTPVITAVNVTGAVKEDAGVVPVNTLHDTGSVTFADADATDHATADIAFVSDTGSPGVTISGALHTALLSALTLQTSAFGSNTGTVNWDFNLDNSLVQYLGEGETVTATYTITVKDDSGTGTDTSVPQTVTVTITGTNDAPTVSAALTDTANEGDGAFTKDLLLNASDVDHGDTLSVANVTYTVDGGTTSGTAPAGISLSGNTLSVDPTDLSFNHLAIGQHTTIEVSYDVKDALGLTVHQTETITIQGTNDTPTVSAALTDTASEGAAAFTKDLLLGASDPDDGETSTLHVTSVTYKVDNGATSSTIPAGLSLGADGHTLTIDPSDPAFDHLAAGQHTTIEVSYGVTDVHGATIDQTETITINGTDDAPVISTANVMLTPAGFGGTKVSGISVSDVDDGGSGQFTLTTIADHGSISPHISTDTLSAINTALQNDVVYTPIDFVPIGHGTLKITDSSGAFDVVNFVFRQSGSDPLTLAENTNQKDVLIGGAGVDQFVFAAHSGQDTVVNFTSGVDKIDFQAISSIDASALTAMLNSATHPVASDTLLHLSATDTVLLKGVNALNTSDFLLHA
jgi:VCBS repeat-containing protein